MKKMLLIMCIFFSACSSKEELPELGIGILAHEYEDICATLTDASGNDLLNPENPNSINVENSQMFYFMGEFNPDIQPNIGFKYLISNPVETDERFSKHHFVHLNVGRYHQNDTTRYLIKWTKDLQDTFTCTFKDRKILKAYLNNKPIYQRNDENKGPIFINFKH